jgi:hypothetical protein
LKASTTVYAACTAALSSSVASVPLSLTIFYAAARASSAFFFAASMVGFVNSKASFNALTYSSVPF